MGEVMGVDLIPQKECVNPEKQVYVFSSNIKKILVTTSRLQKPHFKNPCVQQRGKEVNFFISL